MGVASKKYKVNRIVGSLEVREGFYEVRDDSNAVVGCLWMQKMSSSNYIAYYVLKNGTDFPFNMDTIGHVIHDNASMSADTLPVFLAAALNYMRVSESEIFKRKVEEVHTNTW